jgi:hypothetical protein
MSLSLPPASESGIHRRDYTLPEFPKNVRFPPGYSEMYDTRFVRHSKYLNIGITARENPDNRNRLQLKGYDDA